MRLCSPYRERHLYLKNRMKSYTNEIIIEVMI